MADEYKLYLLDETGGKKRDRSFSFSDDRARLVERHKGEADNVPLKVPTPKEPVEAAKNEGLLSLLKKGLALGLSQTHLITIVSASRPIFRTAMTQFEVLEPITKQADLLESNDEYKLWGLNEDLTFDLMRRHKRLDALDEALKEFPSAVLMSLVATFDSFVAEAVREMLKKYPERYASMNRAIQVSDVLKLKSLDDFIDTLIDEDIYLFSRGSHEEQIKFIEKASTSQSPEFGNVIQTS